jgi:uncharacterized protein (DUF2267 family)
VDLEKTVTMHRDDLLSQVRISARLHGRNQARRVVQAVLRALREHVPETAFRDLVAELPAEVEVTPSGSGEPVSGTSAARRLIRDVARQLHIDEPNAAFYARTTFAQLNVFCRGTTPAQLAARLPADLRPLLSARPEDPAQRQRQLIEAWGAAVTALSLRTPAVATELTDSIPATVPSRAHRAKAPFTKSS